MRGTVIYVSPNFAMAVVQHDDGFAVMEVLGGETARGDEVDGDWDAVGGETITNVTKGEKMDVFLEGSWGSQQTAIAKAARMGGG